MQYETFSFLCSFVFRFFRTHWGLICIKGFVWVLISRMYDFLKKLSVCFSMKRSKSSILFYAWIVCNSLPASWHQLDWVLEWDAVLVPLGLTPAGSESRRGTAPSNKENKLEPTGMQSRTENDTTQLNWYEFHIAVYSTVKQFNLENSEGCYEICYDEVK